MAASVQVGSPYSIFYPSRLVLELSEPVTGENYDMTDVRDMRSESTCPIDVTDDFYNEMRRGDDGRWHIYWLTGEEWDVSFPSEENARQWQVADRQLFLDYICVDEPTSEAWDAYGKASGALFTALGGLSIKRQTEAGRLVDTCQ